MSLYNHRPKLSLSGRRLWPDKPTEDSSELPAPSRPRDGPATRRAAVDIPSAFFQALGSHPAAFLRACSALIERDALSSLSAIGLAPAALADAIELCDPGDPDSFKAISGFARALACSSIPANEQAPVEAALRSASSRRPPDAPSMADFTGKGWTEALLSAPARALWLASPCAKLHPHRACETLGSPSPEDLQACSQPGGFFDQCSGMDHFDSLSKTLSPQRNGLLFFDRLLDAFQTRNETNPLFVLRVLINWIQTFDAPEAQELQGALINRSISTAARVFKSRSTPDESCAIFSSILGSISQNPCQGSFLDEIARLADLVFFSFHKPENGSFEINTTDKYRTGYNKLPSSLSAHLSSGSFGVKIPNTEATRSLFDRFSLADLALAISAPLNTKPETIPPFFSALAEHLAALGLDAAPLERGTPQALRALIDIQDRYEPPRGTEPLTPFETTALCEAAAVSLAAPSTPPHSGSGAPRKAARL